MGTQITCPNPSCGTEFPLEAGFKDEDGKKYGRLMGTLQPTAARALDAYLSLFKPRKTKLSIRRTLVLSGEIVALWNSNTVKRDCVTHSTELSDWVQSMEQMLITKPPSLPLKNHSYLLEVVITTATRRKQAEGFQERAELDKQLARKESDLRAGRGVEPTGGSPSAEETDDERDEAQRNFERQMADLSGQFKASAAAHKNLRLSLDKP